MNLQSDSSDNTKPAGCVLDIGCGTKPHEGANIVMDINPIINNLAEGIEKHVYDLNNIPYPFADCSIDEIYCTQVLEHLNVHVFDFVRECYRILKPNGKIYLHSPNAFFITSRIRFLFGNYVDDTSYHPFHTKLLKPSSLTRHLRQLGFSVNLKYSRRCRFLRAVQSISPDLFCRGIYIEARKRP